MSDEIMSCPHCGADALCLYVSNFRITHPRTGRHVVCRECGARSGPYGYAEEAIAAWNRRAQPAEKVQKVALRKDAREALKAAETLIARIEYFYDGADMFGSASVLKKVRAALVAKDKP